MVTVMINLGFWQLRRLDDRRAANDVVQAALARTPVDFVELLELWEASESSRLAGRADGGSGQPVADYTPATASGAYLADHEVIISNRSFDGQSGSWLATPLQLDDGRLAMVVRGWVPRLNLAGFDPRPNAAPTGPVTITGLAFGSVGGGRVAQTGPGEPAEMSRPDLGRFEEVTGLEVAGLWVRLQQQTPAQSELPIPVPLPRLDGGPHLSYALQWFSFSLGTIVVYGLILRRSTLRSRPPQA